MTAFKQDRDGRTGFMDELGNLCDVINMPCPHSASIRELWEGAKLGHVGFPNLRMRLNEWPNEVPPGRWSVNISSKDSMGLFIEFCDESGTTGTRWTRRDEVVDLVAKREAGHLGTARLLGSRWVDPLIPKSWYATCLNEHGEGCQEPTWTDSQSATTAHPDWLVDVIDQCIVPFTPDTAKYITLSYTWGRVECLKNTTGTLGGLREAGSLDPHQAPTIPRTVRDAMGITRLLGQRYLWVDSLCIVQDDIVGSDRNLNAMDQIYAKSTLCLVAYAGTDANHGLRGIEGISAPRGVKQSILEIAGGENLSRLGRLGDKLGPPDGERLHDGSEYRERGWTYQEFMFAKRRLIFTEGLLRWDCTNARYGEETTGELRHDLWTSKMPHTPLMNNRFPSFKTLNDFISGYNERYFTFQNDAFRAFLGIQSHLGGFFHGGLNYGHPEIFFDISLVWSSYTGVGRRITSNSVPPEGDNLPTWSWMSYIGGIEFPDDSEYTFHEPSADGFTEPVAEWFLMKSPTSPSKMRPVSCEWYRYKTVFKDNYASQVPDGWDREMTSAETPKYRRLSQSWEGGPRSKYPIPVPTLAEAVGPTEQLQFVFAKTTRCKFPARKFDPPKHLNDPFDLYVELCSTSGEFYGFLRVNETKDMDHLLGYDTVELVAVVKGWTTEFHDFLLAIKEEENLRSMPSTAVRPRDWKTWPKKEPETRHQCYFVLCVQWENGVAKRQATGKVFADVWERAQEPVDLILG